VSAAPQVLDVQGPVTFESSGLAADGLPHAGVVDVLSGAIWTGDCGAPLDRVLGGMSRRRTVRCSVNIVRASDGQTVQDLLGHPLVMSGLEGGDIVLIAVAGQGIRDRLADALEQRLVGQGRA
jgi:hypothetical protein